VIATGEKINAATGPFMPVLAKDNASLHKVLYDGSMMAFYQFFFGGEVRHYDYTWFRAKQPGTNTATTPHCDIVYMGRGTKELYTSWTPFGDVPYEMGGLMVLEDSHKNGELKGGYGQTDVDMFCENDSPEARDIVETARREQRELTGEESRNIRWNSSGAYSNDAIAVREELRGRWLTSEYKMATCWSSACIFCTPARITRPTGSVSLRTRVISWHAKPSTSAGLGGIRRRTGSAPNAVWSVER
jgi:hypothetical protein